MRWLGLFAMLPAAAFAERPVTLGEVLEAALVANPAIGRAETSRDMAASAVQAARGAFDPTWTIDGRTGRSQQRGFFQGFPFKADSRSWDLGTGLSSTLPTGTTIGVTGSLDRNRSTFTTDFGITSETETTQDAYTARTSLTVSQPLLRGAWMAFNLQTVTRARDTLDVAELTLEKTRQEILAQVAQAYWTWLTRVELAELADASVAVAEEALRIGRLRVEGGELAPIERTRLEAALVQARSARLDARIAADEARDALRLLVGEGPGGDWIPASEVGEVPVLDLDVDRAVAVALAQNLDVAIARAQLAAARHDRALARHARLPSLVATASAGIGSQEDTAGAAIVGLAGDASFPFIEVGGAFSAPLGNRAARGEVARTDAVVRSRELDLAEIERTVASQVALQVARLVSARHLVDLADEKVRLAEDTLRTEEALAEAGRGLQKDVLAARTELERARIEAVQARTGFRMAQVELLRLQGALEPRDPTLVP